MSQSKLLKAAAADRLGISPKQLERYVSDGMPCAGTGRARRFPWPEIRRWRDERIRSEARAAAERVMGTADAKARKLAAEARTAEIELEQLERTLIPLAIHEERIADFCDRLRAVCLNVPGAYVLRVQAANTAAEAQTVLRALRDELMHTLVATADALQNVDDDA